MTNIIVFQKVQYLKRGAAPRPLAPPARRIHPPLAPLPLAGAGAGGSLAYTDSILRKIANISSLAPLDMVHSTQGFKA